LNRLVLGVKVSHIDDKIFQDEHMSKRGDESWSTKVSIDLSDASESMKPVAVHGTRAADTFST